MYNKSKQGQIKIHRWSKQKPWRGSTPLCLEQFREEPIWLNNLCPPKSRIELFQSWIWNYRQDSNHWQAKKKNLYSHISNHWMDANHDHCKWLGWNTEFEGKWNRTRSDICCYFPDYSFQIKLNQPPSIPPNPPFSSINKELLQTHRQPPYRYSIPDNQLFKSPNRDLIETILQQNHRINWGGFMDHKESIDFPISGY